VKSAIISLSCALVAVAGGSGYEVLHLQRELAVTNATISAYQKKLSDDQTQITNYKKAYQSDTNMLESQQKLIDTLMNKLTNSPTSMPTTSPSASNSSSIPASTSNLVVSNVHATHDGMFIMVTGLVTNKGTSTASATSVNATVYGTDGSIIGSGTTLDPPIPPGSSISFSVLASSSNANATIDHATATVG
jgi:hypothetical protein